MDRTLVRRVLGVRCLRAFSDGCVSLLLPLYLLALGMTPLQVGVITTGTLLGSGLLTLLVGLQAWRFPARALLAAAGVLMAFTGFGLAAFVDFWPLLAVAVIGTLNAGSDDVSVFLPLEHAALSRATATAERTATFARYSLVGALSGAAGALAAGAPALAAKAYGLDLPQVLRIAFAGYAAVGIVAAIVYARLPSASAGAPPEPAAPLGPSRRLVVTLAGFFGLDAFGGGLVVQSMLVLWLHTQYQLSAAATATVFFWAGVLNASSFFFVARLSGRWGLLRTMVYTHAPASALLVVMPLMPSAPWAIALLLARASISSLDVPTRSAYVMALVTPPERAAAASMTAVPRSLASAMGPLISGALLGASSFGWPLVCAGVLKLSYDLLLYARFRGVPLREEPAVNVSSVISDGAPSRFGGPQ